MNTLKFSNRVIILSFCLLIFCGSMDAQGRRFYGGHGYGGYGRYYSSGPFLSVGLGIGAYGYYPYGSYYSPYYGYGYYPGVGVPYLGLRIGTLPYGYFSFNLGPDPYYYYQGTYYRPYGSNQYEVTAPPLGARVPELPKNAKVVVVNGQKYYENSGTYYKESITDNNEIWYIVVGTNGQLNTGGNNITQNDQVGDKLDQLPADSKPVIINKQKYFLAPSGTYYQEVIDGNNVHYEVVGKSSEMK